MANRQPPSRNQQHLVLRPEAWPEIDRRLWQAGLDPGDGLDGPAYAAGLKPITLRNAARGYGRWLAVLAALGELDPSADPAGRVTRQRAGAYLRALRVAGNSNNTIIARFMELRMALRVMRPEADAAFAWLTAPGGRSLASRLPVDRRPIEAIDARVLAGWGRQLMDDAVSLADPRRRGMQFRNGLLIMLLALRAPRLRSIAALRLGRQVLCQGGGARIALEVAGVKNERRLEYGVPADALPYEGIASVVSQTTLRANVS
ncbi:hypothetical protein [Limobrevibacterium gyesilva]|uniref:Uncharacterized protein n=1 Tax=Limobrevibacterium gyesilva TaxID=2991712 RepID=A0AA42CF89_9PROT|nr:hypothetical protein [Limobrevibacterium gyesilva]MCW3476284.1 hypothetical protein [Limobrevibacterium gyesilva]